MKGLAPDLALAVELVKQWDVQWWGRIGDGLIQPTPWISQEGMEGLEEFQGWATPRIGSPESRVAAAVANVSRVVDDLSEVFSYEAESKDGYFEARKWYRSSRAGGYREVENYEVHVRLIHNLVIELIRAINLVIERVRQADRDLLAGHPLAVVAVGPDHKLLEAVKYSKGVAAEPQPYPGLRAFPAAIPSRDPGGFGHYGDGTPRMQEDFERRVEVIEKAVGEGSPSPPEGELPLRLEGPAAGPATARKKDQIPPSLQAVWGVLALFGGILIFLERPWVLGAAVGLAVVTARFHRQIWKWPPHPGLSLLALATAVALGTLGQVVFDELVGGDSSQSATANFADATSKDEVKDGEAPPRDPFEGGMKVGWGPARATFRCARPSACSGPHYVTFNSYFNTVNYGDERDFLNVKRHGDPLTAPWNNILRIERSGLLIMRAYIDNNTFKTLPGRESTDALDTRLRLALPDGPVYEARPTAYLRAENARPQVIWDDVHLYASRPMTMSYVPDSAAITQRGDAGKFLTKAAPAGVATLDGMKLGRWKADFRNAALVTFRVRVAFLSEPVQDPRATWQTYSVAAVNLPPQPKGTLREPKVDSSVGARFNCGTDSCTGPPYVTLNTYQNHPLLGDEADFVRGELTSTYGDTGEHRYGSVVSVRPGDQLFVRVALDNGGDPEAIGAPPAQQLVARDVHVRVMLPKGPANSQDLVAFVESSNANPMQIADSLPIRSEEPVRIRYLPGSASIATSWTSKRAGSRLFALSDQARAAEERGWWGIEVPDIPPSFSRVTYLGFTVVAWPA